MAEVRYVQATRLYPGTDAPAVDALDLDVHDGSSWCSWDQVGVRRGRQRSACSPVWKRSDAGAVYIGASRCQRRAAQGPRRLDGVPELCALPVSHRCRKHRFPLADRESEEGRAWKRVKEVAKLLGLSEYLERKPGQLSGGQRQRVAMGRAIVRVPSVFLMDEPLSNLDAKLRVHLRADIAALQADFGITTVYVTHDQSEAMTLGHRVAVLNEGTSAAVRPAAGLYERPTNVFVAGVRRLPVDEPLHGAVSNGAASFGGVDVPLPQGVAANGRTSLVIEMRPESLEVAPDGIPAKVDVVEDIGADAFVFCSAELGGDDKRNSWRVPSRVRHQSRATGVTLRPRSDEAHLFDPASGERLER